MERSRAANEDALDLAALARDLKNFASLESRVDSSLMDTFKLNRIREDLDQGPSLLVLDNIKADVCFSRHQQRLTVVSALGQSGRNKSDSRGEEFFLESGEESAARRIHELGNIVRNRCGAHVGRIQATSRLWRREVTPVARDEPGRLESAPKIGVATASD